MLYSWLFGTLFGILMLVGVALCVLLTKVKWKLSGILLTLISSICFLCIPFSYGTIDSGEIAVVKEMGKIVDTREAGVHFDFWMTRSYERYDTKVRQLDITTQSYSNDKQTMDVAMTVQYQIKRDSVKTIAATYGGLSALEGRIQSVAIERTKAVLSSYTADRIIMERSTVSSSVTTEVENSVGDNYYVDITMVALTNIDFSDVYEKAVEDKMVAEQAKLQKDYENQAAKAAAETEADVKKLQADADAYAKEKQAEADAKALILKAEADAKALNIQTLEVAKMFGLTTEVVVKVDENNKPIQATDADGNLLYLDSKGNYTTEAKTNDVENEKIFVFIERIKPGADTSIIAKYIEYIKYLETWDGKLPEVVTDGSGLIIQP